MSLEGSSYGAAVVGEDLRIRGTALLDQACRPFDVREQKSDRPGRERGPPLSYSR